MNTYAAHWNSKRIEVQAKTAYEAQQIAAEHCAQTLTRIHDHRRQGLQQPHWSTHTHHKPLASHGGMTSWQS